MEVIHGVAVDSVVKDVLMLKCAGKVMLATMLVSAMVLLPNTFSGLDQTEKPEDADEEDGDGENDGEDTSEEGGEAYKGTNPSNGKSNKEEETKGGDIEGEEINGKDDDDEDGDRDRNGDEDDDDDDDDDNEDEDEDEEEEVVEEDENENEEEVDEDEEALQPPKKRKK